MSPAEIVLLEQQIKQLEQQIEQLEQHSLMLNRGLYTDGLMLHQLREQLKSVTERLNG